MEDPRDYRRGGYHLVHVAELFKHGRYVAAKKLGWGHFSTVWLAWDRQQQRAVALKIQKAAAKYAETAKDEVKLLKQVSEAFARHRDCRGLVSPQPQPLGAPADGATSGRGNAVDDGDVIGSVQNSFVKDAGIVELRDHFVHRGPHGAHHVMCFEVLGPSLLQMLKATDYRGLPLSQARRLARCLLSALAFIHAEGIIHTDVKPENVLEVLNPTDAAGFDTIARRVDAASRAADPTVGDGGRAVCAGAVYGGDAIGNTVARSRNARKRAKQKEKKRMQVAGESHAQGEHGEKTKQAGENGASEPATATTALLDSNRASSGASGTVEETVSRDGACDVADVESRMNALSVVDGPSIAKGALGKNTEERQCDATAPMISDVAGAKADAWPAVPDENGGHWIKTASVDTLHDQSLEAKKLQKEPHVANANGTAGRKENESQASSTRRGTSWAPAYAQIDPSSPDAPTFKLADLGNGCWRDRHFTEDIQTRQYRCPEVIMGQGYDVASDVWSAACVVFEAVTGDMLFTPKAGKSWSRDEDHLALIIELLGPFPRCQTTQGTFAKDFFRGGELRHIKKLRPWSLVDVLTEKYEMTPENAHALADFLLPMLRHDPTARATAEEALRHPWLNE